MLLGGCFLSLFEIYEVRNYYLIVILSIYTLKILTLNIITTLGTIKMKMKM